MRLNHNLKSFLQFWGFKKYFTYIFGKWDTISKILQMKRERILNWITQYPL